MVTKVNDVLGLNCGIYCIFNAVNGKVYVGSSVNLYMRKAQHFSSLKYDKHHSIKLQRAYNKYGKDSFKFCILEYCDKKDLEKVEKSWIACCNSYSGGYNSTDECGAPSRGKKYSIMRKKLHSQPVKLIKPDGTLVEYYGQHECAKHENLSRSGIRLLKLGQITHCNGYRLYDATLLGVVFNKQAHLRKAMCRSKHCLQFKFISPEGLVFEGHNITEFARQKGLRKDQLCRLHKGQISNHKGWKLYKE